MGFSSPSDTEEEEDSTISEIISQAKDSILLQQISAINCSSFTHSDLPPNLESRFNKLKSFPANHTPPPPYLSKNPTFSTPKNPNSDSQSVSSPSKHATFSNPSSTKIQKNLNFSPPKDNNSTKNPLSDSGSVSSHSNSSHREKGLNPKPKNGSFSPSDSSHTSEESPISSLQMKREENKCSKVKSMSLSPESSPPRKWGCFWCSPKKEQNKKKSRDKENAGVVGWEECTSDELLSGIGSLSSKKRLNMIEKALKEEEKRINREAEKIVEWAKHVSGRMNVPDIEDELSDD
ncbi:hypothetical protein MtrunA17_Chr5g0408961 [Medicago truncatula]|uniref:Uncharacterized protein n=1 Tax=Medicago truncatula TaxID=3880 RepID=G7K5G5_MEDTR|nr:uncharacterized protein LOC11407097 [Medicago truncatula]AES95515.1 hypothetical protein MTR_5g026390 [Medicago truncatula]RHN54627.1 hypothetical protein MtrunA17_Chr5g0408961 [Medicago truncatula]